MRDMFALTVNGNSNRLILTQASEQLEASEEAASQARDLKPKSGNIDKQGTAEMSTEL